MTRKDFRALADAIASIDDLDHRIQTAKLIGEVCRAYNVNFDRSCWNSACRVTSAALALDKLTIST